MDPKEHEYMHAHGIPHEHAHDHDHAHDACAAQNCGHDCAGCGDPRAEAIALMKYMVGHNTAHAGELAQLADKLRGMGENAAAEQVMQAVSDFEKGNMRLSMVLAALNA